MLSMKLSLILLIATGSLMSCASRVKYKAEFGIVPHALTRPMMHQASLMHTPVNLPQLRMQVPSKLWYTGGLSVLSPRWETKISGTRISQQTFPPTTIYSADTIQLLQKWADLFIDSFDEEVRASASTDTASPAPPSKTAKGFEDAKALALYGMHDVVSQVTGSFTHLGEDTINRVLSVSGKHKEFEMVGLVPKGFEMPFVTRAPSAFSVPVLALGVFARDKVDDDRRGSLRKKIKEQYGKRWTRSRWGLPKKQFDVFAIEGLVDAPGPDFDERSAKLLLTKMGQYAYKERKFIVVPQWAYISRGGADLTEYYERLGFEKVEMEGRSHSLVYTGTSSPAEDVLEKKQPIMVGMDFWTGVP